MVVAIIAAIYVAGFAWMAYEIKNAPLLDENERPVYQKPKLKVIKGGVK